VLRACTTHLVVFILVVTAACGAKTYPVRGKVVYKGDGKPVPGGVVVWFESTTPPYERASGVVESDGGFYLSTNRDGSGALQGEHRVRFEPAVPYAEADAESALAKTMPPRYREFRTSGLKHVVQPGENTFTIEVDRPAKR
jgi:hypothetical protein